jgi:hypothetical protein
MQILFFTPAFMAYKTLVFFGLSFLLLSILVAQERQITTEGLTPSMSSSEEGMSQSEERVLEGEPPYEAPFNVPDKEIASLKWGNLEIHPHFDAQVVYDDNIFIRQTNRVDDWIYTLSPGILLHAGDYFKKDENFVAVDYTPSIIIFGENSSSDNVDHEAVFDSQYRFTKLTLGLAQVFQALSGTVIDVGTRVDRNIYTTDFTSSYELTGKSSVEVNLRYSATEYSSGTLFDYNEWINQNWYNYQIAPKTQVGAGVMFGFLNVDQTPDQDYQQALLRVIYNPTGKLTLRGSGGFEWRQSDTVNEDRFTPVFSAGVGYQPFDGTHLDLDVFRRVQSSASSFGQDFTSSGVTFNARQRFFQKFFVGVRTGFENLNYHSYVPGIIASREDDYLFVQPSLSYDFSSNVSASLFYLYRENDSNQPSVSFDNNQVGVRVSVLF